MKEKNPEISNILEYIIYHATYTIFTLLAIWNASENTKTNLTLKTVEQKEHQKKNCDKRAHILTISSSLQSPNNSAVTPLFLSLLFDDSFHHHGLYYWQIFLKSQFYKTILHFLSEAILQKHFQNAGKRIWINEKLNVRGVIVLLTFFQFLFWIFFISVPCFPNCALLCSHILGRSKIKLQGWC